jgi:DNA primase
VFKFLELHEKVGFQDAVRMLAQKFGVAIPEAVEGEDARRDAGLRESLLKMHEIAGAFFREQLVGPAGARARQQLKDRDVSPQTIEALGLARSPDTSRAEGASADPGFPQGLLLQSGLILQRDGGDVVDRFRNRR